MSNGNVPVRNAESKPRGDRRPSKDRHELHKIDGQERARWQKAVMATRGLGGPAKAVLIILTMCHCHGKPYAFPGDSLLSEEADTSVATISRALAKLVKSDTLRIVRRRGSLLRYLVILSHPRAAAFLAEPGVHAWGSRSPKKGKHPSVSIPQSEESNSSERGIRILNLRNPNPQSEESYFEAENLNLKGNSNNNTPELLLVSSSTLGEETEEAELDPDAELFRDAIQEASNLVENALDAIRQLRQDVPGATPDVTLFAIVDTIKARDAGRIKKGDPWSYLVGMLKRRVAKGKTVPLPPRVQPQTAPRPSSPPPPPPRPLTPEERAAAQQRATQLQVERQRLEKQREIDERKAKANDLLAMIRKQGHRVELGPEGDFVWHLPSLPGPATPSMQSEFDRMWANEQKSFMGKIGPIEPDVRELLQAQQLQGVPS